MFGHYYVVLIDRDSIIPTEHPFCNGPQPIYTSLALIP